MTSRTCECGCGTPVGPDQRFKRGHHMRVQSIRERIVAKMRAANDAANGPRFVVVPETGCWLWLWGTNGQGRAVEYRRREIYERSYGVTYPTGRGWHLHHHCREPLCVNPDHAQPMPRELHGALHRELNANGWRDLSVPDRVELSERLFCDMVSARA